ncbi:MAG: hypothetical protein ACYTDT_07740 [Planctomycetota bacterium]|jgi:hypothetical protein
MASSIQALLADANRLIQEVEPVSYGQPEPAETTEILVVLRRLRAKLPGRDRDLVPTDKALKKWQMLSRQEFANQRDAIADNLRLLESSLSKSPLPSHIAKILERPELGQVKDNLMQAHGNLLRKDWKACVVMAGASLEALLHTRIAEDQVKFARAFLDLWPLRKVPAAPTDYRPADSIRVIVEAGCLPSALGKYAEGLQQSRNVVHPAVEAGEKLTPAALDAEIAINTVLMVIERLWPDAAKM